ncbi:MAG: DUF4386 domain-containing protein [Anaerolineales bacterium]|jgi:hypothetical protein
MMTAEEEINPNRIARVAGILYLIIFCLGIFAELFVRQSLIVPGDAATTVNNIMASESLFRISLVSDLIRHTFLILLPLVLYQLLKPVGKNIALLMVIFALAGVPIALLNMLNHFAALLLLSGADYLTAFEADQLHAQVMFFLDLYEYGAFIPQFLGLWLLPLGYLVFKSGFLPRILGILLMIGCFGYVIDAVLFFLFASSAATLSLFAFIGELLFALWLLIKGVNIEQWEKLALESA